MMKSEDYKENLLVSIIVPVYNVEPYLRRCLDSIINQTYKNIEIILVDDGSTDNSGLICDEYALNNKRIKVIHKENGGPSEARNFGLSICQGDFIGFIDSDDYISNIFVERMIAGHANHQLLMCRTERTNGERSCVPRPFEYSENEITITGEEAYSLLCRELIDCSCCDKLFSKTLLQYLKFPVGKVNEELNVLTNCFLNSSNIFYVKDALYTYYSRPNSITTSSFSKNQFDKVYNSYENIAIVREKNKGLLMLSKSYHIRQCFYLYKKLVVNKELREKYNEDYRFIVSSLKKNFFALLTSKYFKAKEKLSIMYALFLPHLYYKNHI